MRVLAISGSLREGSLNRRLLEAAGELTGPRSELEILEPGALAALPIYDEDVEAEPGEAVERLRSEIGAADALLFATPEYNSSIPGGLKNAIDWASRPRGEAALAGKPAAVIGASPSPFGAVWAQAELRKILGSAGARALESELAVGRAPEAFDERGRLSDPSQRERLAELLGELVEEAGNDVEQRLAAAA